MSDLEALAQFQVINTLTCRWNAEVPTFDSETVPPTYHRCERRAVALWFVRHDGQTCGCPQGLCAFDPDSGNFDLDSYVEMWPVCENHEEAVKAFLACNVEHDSAVCLPLR